MRSSRTGGGHRPLSLAIGAMAVCAATAAAAAPPGTFKQADSSPEAMGPGSDRAELPELADVTRDGRPDLLAVSGYTQISVLRGRRNGDFRPAVTETVAQGNIWQTATARLDGDSNPDLAVATLAGTEIFLGDGAGEFEPAATSPEAGALGVAAGNFDGDRDVDLAIAEGQDGQDEILILENNGDADFSVADTVVIPDAQSIERADLEPDGDLDLLAFDGSDDRPVIVTNDGSGDFTYTAEEFPADEEDMRGFAVGRVTPDNRPDIAYFTDDGIRVYRNAGQAEFAYFPWVVGSGREFDATAIFDLDRDGRGDLVAVESVPSESGDVSRLVTFLGRPGNTFREAKRRPRIATNAGGESGISAGRIDGGRRPDVVATVKGRAHVFLGQ